MSLLEVITKASSNINTLSDQRSKYPIGLTPPLYSNLKAETSEIQTQVPVKKVTGWEISGIDVAIAELGQKFFKKLQRNLKNTNEFGAVEFLEMLTSHLKNVLSKTVKSFDSSESKEAYHCELIEKVGGMMGRDVIGLIIECCIRFEVWDVLECLIVNGHVEHAFTSHLIHNLIEKHKSDLVVLCMKHFVDLQTYEVMCIMKYFLMLPDDGYEGLVSVREDWEKQAFLAIEKAGGNYTSVIENALAKEAAMLVMLGHDGFSVPELCLHHLLASSSLDDAIFSACVGKLNGEELKVLIRYLGKWLRKYERFPQVGPCYKASSVLGLYVCDWIPSLDTVVKFLSLLIDEHFSSLVLNTSEFHEVRGLEEVVTSLAAEAKLCGALVNLSERLKIEHKGYRRGSL